MDTLGTTGEVTLIPFGLVERDEAYALTELDNSPFAVTPKVDPSLISINDVEVRMFPWNDANTRTYYSDIDNKTL